MCADHEIHPSVTIQVPKSHATRPILRVERCVLEHRRQLHGLAIPIPQLTEKQAIAVSHKKIRPPVFIKIHHRETETENVRRQPGRCAGVRKLQSAEIAQQEPNAEPW